MDTTVSLLKSRRQVTVTVISGVDFLRRTDNLFEINDDQWIGSDASVNQKRMVGYST